MGDHHRLDYPRLLAASADLPVYLDNAAAQVIIPAGPNRIGLPGQAIWINLLSGPGCTNAGAGGTEIRGRPESSARRGPGNKMTTQNQQKSDLEQPAKAEGSAGSSRRPSEQPGAGRRSGRTAPWAAVPLNPDFIGKLTNWQLVRYMFQFVRPVQRTAVLACSLVVAGVLLEVMAVNLTRVVINKDKILLQADKQRVIKSHAVMPATRAWHQFLHGPFHLVLLLVLLLAGLVLLSGICNYFRTVVNTRLSMNMVFHMRSAVYDQLQRVGFSFHNQHTSGQLINRALSDLHNIRFFINLSLVSIAEIVFYVLGYNILVAAINPWIGLATLLPVPFWIIYIVRFGKRMQPVQKSLMDTGDALVTVYGENVAGVQVVKAFATQTTETGKYNATLDRLFGQTMSTVGMWANFIPVIRGIATASNLVLFLIGSFLAVHGILHPGDIFVFGVAMGAILSRLQQINQITNQYQTAVVSARRFFEILYATPAIPDPPGLPDLPAGPGRVDFSYVTFGYDARRPVLRDISFSAPAGSMVALVGPTGAGKSTLMQLLARFYDPQAGTITLDGTAINQISLASLRKNIGFVFQETFLFSDTIAANIRYGNPKASDGEVEAAARLAQAHDFISVLPRQYATMLGERGMTLSGGQKQRLAIARAIVANPRILVLDDALAAVDPATEHLIRKALELMMQDRTVFVIAHRLSTVKAADLVVVLEDGRVTQIGPHDELMAQAGHYRYIAEVQLLGKSATLLPVESSHKTRFAGEVGR